MASSKVETHFARYHASRAVRLYALLDGLLYARAAPIGTIGAVGKRGCTL